MAVDKFNIKDLDVTSTLSISGSPVINSNGSNQVIVNSGATGDIGLLLTSNTKAVSLEVATNQQLTVKGGADSFIFDVSSGTGGITFPDGTTQNTAAGGGLSPGTTTGVMLYWNGADWVQTGTGPNNQILYDGANEITLTNIAGAGGRYTRLAGTTPQFFSTYAYNDFVISNSGSKTEVYSNTAEINMQQILD